MEKNFINEGEYTKDIYQSEIYKSLEPQVLIEDEEQNIEFNDYNKLVIVIKTKEELQITNRILNRPSNQLCKKYNLYIVSPDSTNSAFDRGLIELDWSKFKLFKRYGLDIYLIIDEENNLNKFNGYELIDPEVIGNLIYEDEIENKEIIENKEDEIKINSNIIDKDIERYEVNLEEKLRIKRNEVNFEDIDKVDDDTEELKFESYLINKHEKDNDFYDSLNDDIVDEDIENNNLYEDILMNDPSLFWDMPE